MRSRASLTGREPHLPPLTPHTRSTHIIIAPPRITFDGLVLSRGQTLKANPSNPPRPTAKLCPAWTDGSASHGSVRGPLIARISTTLQHVMYGPRSYAADQSTGGWANGESEIIRISIVKFRSLYVCWRLLLVFVLY